MQPQPHIRKKSGSEVMGQKALGQSDCSIFQILKNRLIIWADFLYDVVKP